jgi:peptide chain release factor 1
MKILRARLLKKERSLSLEKMDDKRKTQIGWAERSEKIRTYNFPQNRLTDHRINKSWYELEKIMQGKMDKIINTLSAKKQ